MNFDFTQLVGNTNTAPAVKVAPIPVAKVVEPKKEVAEEKPKTEKQATNVAPIEKAKEQMKEKVKEVKKAKASNSNDIVRLSKDMEAITSYLNTKFLEREEEIKMLSIAFVSGTNAFLHGKPGTGKSDLVESFSNCFDGSNYFRMLMSKTTEPSEVFGPVSLNALKNDSYKVVTNNKLPKANIAFLDEVFKANSAVLNGMLTIMNERLFFNDVVEEVPLVSIVGASNEFPEEEGLSALYDRFLLRWNVEAIQDANNRDKLFRNFIASRNNNSTINGGSQVAMTLPTMTFDDLNSFIELAKSVTFDDAIILEYNKLFLELEKQGIEVSDRRKNEAIKAIQAHAALEGRLHAELSDFAPLVYCFWEELDEIAVIKSIIQKLSNPDADFLDEYNKSLKDYKATINEFMTEHKDDDNFDVSKAVKATEVRSAIIYAIDKIAEKKDSVSNPKTKEKLESLHKDFVDFAKHLADLLIG